MDGSCSDDVINLGPLDDLNRAPTAGTAPFDFLPIQGGGAQKTTSTTSQRNVIFLRPFNLKSAITEQLSGGTF